MRRARRISPHHAERAEAERLRLERERTERARWLQAEGPCPADLWASSAVVASFDWSDCHGGHLTHVRQHTGGGAYFQRADASGGWSFSPAVLADGCAEVPLTATARAAIAAELQKFGIRPETALAALAELGIRVDAGPDEPDVIRARAIRGLVDCRSAADWHVWLTDNGPGWASDLRRRMLGDLVDFTRFGYYDRERDGRYRRCTWQPSLGNREFD